jgi:hypothetical protein
VDLDKLEAHLDELEAANLKIAEEYAEERSDLLADLKEARGLLDEMDADNYDDAFIERVRRFLGRTK